jgi:hypothetical protein
LFRKAQVVWILTDSVGIADDWDDSCSGFIISRPLAVVVDLCFAAFTLALLRINLPSIEAVR